MSDLSIYLLAIRGTLAPDTLEAARQVHNQTAGNPAGVAAAQSLGDVSHNVFVPVEHEGHAKTKGAGEFLILDLWTSVEGLNTFFSDKQVQEGGSMIFTERDPVVWHAAEGFTSYHIPAPFGVNDRFVTTLRGTLKSIDEACRLHNSSIARTISKARKAGNLSHEAYLRMAAPGSPEAMEFFGVDVWTRLDDMMGYYEDPEFLEGFDHLFTAEGTTGLWVHPKGDWVEW
ncbi:MAG TPA: hypothetical protein VK249_08295 [Anaerolineales bacterium]|nr:hypothetical protein [Anaerolineales bacterium]